jgi:hypothetical protein
VTDAATTIDSLRNIRDNLREIKAMPGFAYWQQYVKAQEEGRRPVLYEQLGDSPNAVAQQEYMKGEICGIVLAVKAWDLLEALATEELEKAQQDEETAK